MPDIMTVTVTESEIFGCILYVSYTDAEMRYLSALDSLFQDTP